MFHGPYFRHVAIGSFTRSELEYDPEVFADQELPVLIVGTKHVSIIILSI